MSEGEPFGINAEGERVPLSAVDIAWIEAMRAIPSPVDLAAYAASARWDAEVAGAKWNGWDLPTDDRSQAKYMAELQAVGLDVRDDPSPWKFPHGFELVTNAEVEEMAVAARVHVLACFAREGEVQAAISAGDVTTMAAIDEAFADVSTPWFASA